MHCSGAVAAFAAPWRPHAPGSQPKPAWGLPQLMHELGRSDRRPAASPSARPSHVLKAPADDIRHADLRRARLSAEDRRCRRFREISPSIAVRRRSPAGGTHQTHSFSLAEAPQIAGLVEGIRATLAGDLPTLERFYTVRLTGDDGGVAAPPAAEECASWHISSDGCAFGQPGIASTAIDTASGNGDHSEMSIVEDAIDAG